MTDITQDEFHEALTHDLRLTRTQAKEALGMPDDDIFTNYREVLAQLGHPKYQVQTLAQAAEEYADAGIPVFPLVPGDKKPAISGGKGLHDATTDPAQVQAWWRQLPNANIGSPIPVGYVVFDVDAKSDGKLETLGDLPRTAVARSGGGGGWHVWFRLPDDMEKAPKKQYSALPGIEVWGVGHYMVLPPSVVNNQYAWEGEPGVDSDSIADIPEHLVDILVGKPDHNGRETRPEQSGNPTTIVGKPNRDGRETQPKPANCSAAPMQHTVAPTQPDTAPEQQNRWLTQAIDRAMMGTDGGRNETGKWLVLQLRDDGLIIDEAAVWIRKYQQEVSDWDTHPYTVDEAFATLRSIYSREPRESAIRLEESEKSLDAGSDRLDLLLSSLDFSSLPLPLDFSSCKVQFMRLSEEADSIQAEHLDDRRCAPGTPHYIRRQAQWKVLRALWSMLAPGDTLPINLMSKWLSKCEQNEPGIECIQVVDCLFATYENHLQFGKGKDIRHPRQFYGDALLHQLDENFGWKRAELKAKAKAAAKGQEPIEGLVRVWEEPGA